MMWWIAAAMAAEVTLLPCAAGESEEIARFTSSKGDRLQFVNLRTESVVLPAVIHEEECEVLSWDIPIGWSKVVGVSGSFVGSLEGSDGGELRFVVSKDAGKTWTHTGMLPRPQLGAPIRMMEFKSSGKGRVSFEVMDPLLTQGMHRYQTDDWGETWRLIEIVPLTQFQK